MVGTPSPFLNASNIRGATTTWHLPPKRVLHVSTQGIELDQPLTDLLADSTLMVLDLRRCIWEPIKNFSLILTISSILR